MGSFNDEVIKRKVASGLVILGIRRVFYQVILTSSNIFLARVLNPEIFGSFAIISFIVLTCGLFVNFGLGPALIQNKSKVSSYQIKTIFTVLTLSSLFIIIIIIFLAPVLQIFYKGRLGETEVFWLRIFSLSLFLNHSTAISFFLLKRNLEYKKLTIAEISILLITQMLVIFFANKGLGIGSFVLGNLIGGVAGIFIFYRLAPWSIGFNFSLSKLKNFLKFGLNFQANSLIGAINASVIPGFVGAVSGPKAVGLINWAGGIRQADLAPVEIVENLVFSAGSRVQENKKLLKLLTEKMLEICCMLSFPLLSVTFILAPSIITIVYTSKWLEGLITLRLSIIGGFFILIGVVLIEVLFAMGKAKEVRNISLFWAIMQWILSVPLVLIWNYNGVILAGILVSMTFFIPLSVIRKDLKVEILPLILPYLIYSSVMGFFVFLLTKIIVVVSIWQLIFIFTLGLLFYVLLLAIFERKSIFNNLIRFKSLIINE